MQTIKNGLGNKRRRMLLAAVCIVLAAAILAAGVFLLRRPKGMEHYLLIGIDGWGVNVEGAGRSDVIMLASLDYDGNRVVLTSFARDSLVEPSWRSSAVKLNTLVRSTEGEQALINYLEETYGVEIQGYFVVNFSGAVDIVDAIGGIDVELTHQEVRYLKEHAGDYSGFPLLEGKCRMNGAQTLAYMRCRKLDNDFGRQNRQGNALRAVMAELSNITPRKAVALLGAIGGMYRTDLSLAEQTALAKNAVYLRRGAMEKYSIPAEGTYRYGTGKDGESVLKFDLEENQALLRSWLGMKAPQDGEEPVAEE